MNAPAPASGSRPAATFSPSRVWALSKNTFTQLVRMRVFFFLLIFVAVVTAVALLFVAHTREQELKMLRDIGLGTMWLFSSIFAIVGTAILLPKDIKGRTLYTILTKPVPRIEYLLGKFFGVLILIFLSLLAMDALLCILLYFREAASIAQIEASLASLPEGSREAIALQAEGEGVRRLGLTWGIHQGVASIFLMAVVLAALSMFLSTFASSTLFTVVVGFAVFCIGYGQSLARDYFLGGGEIGLGERLVTAALALVFPDLQMYSIADSIAGGAVAAAGVMWKLGGLTLLYALFYTVLSYLVFSTKEF